MSWAFAQYMEQKRAQQPTDDPVADLRAAWDVHVGFGLQHPVLYRLMFGDGGASPAARQAEEALARMLGRSADAGRLACSVPRAVALVHGSAMGMVLFTLARPDAERDLAALDATGDHVVALVTTAPAASAGEPAASGARSRAASLRAALDTDTATAATFTRGERALLTEWLDRLADGERADPDHRRDAATASSSSFRRPWTLAAVGPGRAGDALAGPARSSEDRDRRLGQVDGLTDRGRGRLGPAQ